MLCAVGTTWVMPYISDQCKQWKVKKKKDQQAM